MRTLFTAILFAIITASMAMAETVIKETISDDEFLATCQKEFKAEPVLPPPLVGGEDILARGVPRGPLVGRLKQAVYDAQLEGKCRSREEALERLEREISRAREKKTEIASTHAEYSEKRLMKGSETNGPLPLFSSVN